MIKFILMLVLVTGVSYLKAQNVGISTTGTPPRDCAMLDISSSDKGLIIPTVTLTSSTSYSPPITSTVVVDGLLVYNTSTVNSSASGLRGKGFYFWSTDNSKWMQLCVDCSAFAGGKESSSMSIISSQSENSPKKQILNTNLSNNYLQNVNFQNPNIYSNKELISKGSVKLEKGNANVVLDNNFLELCDVNSLVITATPLGNCKGIYIDETSQQGFKIKELNGGQSNIKVNFIIIGQLKSSNLPKD